MKLTLTLGVSLAAATVLFLLCNGSVRMTSRISSVGPLDAGSVRDPEHGCGPISLSVVSHVLGRPVLLEDAQRATAPDPLGRTSMADLVAGLKHHGFGAAAVHLSSFAELPASTAMIVHLRGNHWAVAVAGGDGAAVLIDPPAEPLRCGAEALVGACDGNCIVVTGDPAEVADMLRRAGVGRR